MHTFILQAFSWEKSENAHIFNKMGLRRRLSVNLLKPEPSRQSMVQKRYRAAMDNDFVTKALLSNDVS
ncbi:MAG: hypothetical protein MJA27_20510 [Pseudanabaenales cyanobacterium]|nr:hypothetical protein [Pseudanabaenales cyanobacterium]